MKKLLVFVFVLLGIGVLQSQSSSNYHSTNYGTRNYNSSLNSFKYGIIGSNQDATGSPTGLVSTIVRKVPSAKKITDRFGNVNLSLRGRNSVFAAGDEVLWDVDGVSYKTPPILSINEVVYVEIIKGLAAGNKYGSAGAGGIVIVKTSVSASKQELISSPKNLWRSVTEKRVKKK